MALKLGDQAAKDPAAAAGLEHRIIIFIAGYSGEHRQGEEEEEEEEEEEDGRVESR